MRRSCVDDPFPQRRWKLVVLLRLARLGLDLPVESGEVLLRAVGTAEEVLVERGMEIRRGVLVQLMLLGSQRMGPLRDDALRSL